MVEDEAEDHSADPMLSSRHLPPHPRKRTDDEFRDHTVAEEDVGDARRQTKRSRGPPKTRDQSVPGGQSLVNLAPAPQPQPQQGTSEGETSLLVSNKGQKLRLIPPAKPLRESDGLPASARVPSSPSPSLSSPDERPVTSYSAGPFSANGNASQHHLQSGSSSNTSSAHGQSAALPVPNSPASSVQPSEIQRHAKPKRLKAHTVTSKSYSIPTVPRDKKGRPLLPLTVGIMTVHNLGEVCMREHFHTERYIFPVGYEVTRRYHSTVDPNSEAVYQCSILDGGDGPKFKIVGSDVPNCPIIAGTATGAWSNIVKQANAIRNRQHSNSVSGPDFFGLGQNTIKHLIQELPGADRLRDYVWQHFAEGG
ncbi:hypothetical protein SCLCIDRAFT_135943 [Scleroderma citrinum Foug A]|uniref:FYR N-terminal domain-containing protein n=1 Tax=Scleroderma citrinum Foug A TaxID=1036808 RepID=A0A0C2ZQD3_9AGAM|nr:hypothetical protein SCLCIDRAFT_135943 [Scleroderma citrinum Foug A]